MRIDPPNHSDLLLIRHPQVHGRYRGVCYGRSDVELSVAGRRSSREIAQRLARLPVRHIVHSGLQRTAFLATALARITGLAAQQYPALAERNFGSWELESWDSIYQREGDSMLKMISEPATYRPGEGETTDEMAGRVWNWYRGWQGRGLTVAVTHGGPIAACLGRQRGIPVAEWTALIPACGACVWADSGRPSHRSPA